MKTLVVRPMTLLLAMLGLLLAATVSLAQGPTRDAQAEWDTAVAAARKVAKPGPATVPMLDQAELRLPDQYVFIPSTEAAGLLRSMGNRPGDDLLGMIFSNKDNAGDAFLVLRYVKAGYIKDDDAKDWDVDEMLASIKAGTEESNADRRSRGLDELEVVGWVERPRYDAAAHQLKWSLSSKKKGEANNTDQGVNYNTYALGREGYISMNLVTALAVVEAQKPMVSQLLGGLQFNDGKRYADFNASTDRVAEYGLAALVGGVAAKKLGFFALAAAFVAKFAKVIGLAVVGLGAGAFRVFRTKKAAPPNTGHGSANG